MWRPTCVSISCREQLVKRAAIGLSERNVFPANSLWVILWRCVIPSNGRTDESERIWKEGAVISRHLPWGTDEKQRISYVMMPVFRQRFQTSSSQIQVTDQPASFSNKSYKGRHNMHFTTNKLLPQPYDSRDKTNCALDNISELAC
jgi:hypothetical protein